MAETDFQERTEQATPKRQEEARRRGQVARSRELNIAAVLLAGAGVIAVSRAQLGSALEDLMRRGLTPDPRLLDQPGTMTAALASASIDTLLAFTPLLVVLALAAVGGALAVGGWVFSTEQVAPRWSRLDPVQGIKRIFSLRGLVEVAKALANDKDASETLDRTLQHLRDNNVDPQTTKITLGPKLTLAGKEVFSGPQAEEANKHLSRDYRAPFIVPATEDL